MRSLATIMHLDKHVNWYRCYFVWMLLVRERNTTIFCSILIIVYTHKPAKKKTIKIKERNEMSTFDDALHSNSFHNI